MAIDTELEKYFSDMDELFETQGWQTLVGDLKHNAVHIQSVEHCKTIEDLHFRKGQLAVLTQMVTLAASTRDAHEQAIREDSEEVHNGD